MLVSVAIPVYNAEEYIRDAIDSVLSQTYSEFEIILVNDASSDKSVEIIESYDDPRIKLFHNKANSGVAATINHAIEKSTGELIARMDADDICMPDRFEKQVAFLKEHPEIGIVGSAAIHMDENGRPTSARLQPETDQLIRFQHVLMPAFYHPSLMFRAEIFKKHNLLYDIDHPSGQDLELLQRCEVITKIHNIQEPLIYYREHASSISRKNKTKRVAGKMAIAQARIEHIGLAGTQKENALLAFEAWLDDTKPLSQPSKALSGLIAMHKQFEQFDGKKLPWKAKAMLVRWYLNVVANKGKGALIHLALWHPIHTLCFVRYALMYKSWRKQQKPKMKR